MGLINYIITSNCQLISMIKLRIHIALEMQKIFFSLNWKNKTNPGLSTGQNQNFERQNFRGKIRGWWNTGPCMPRATRYVGTFITLWYVHVPMSVKRYQLNITQQDYKSK